MFRSRPGSPSRQGEAKSMGQRGMGVASVVGAIAVAMGVWALHPLFADTAGTDVARSDAAGPDADSPSNTPFHEMMIYPDSPPPGNTGGFGEPTCHDCHFDNPANDPVGSLVLEGFPEAYEPGRSYELSVRLSHPELERAGFQISARYGEGAAAGSNAGQFIPGTGLGIITDSVGSVKYLQQVIEREPAEPGRAFWDFVWVAPDAGAQVVFFHAAANAANGDASEFGDRIYSAEHRGSPAPFEP